MIGPIFVALSDKPEYANVLFLKVDVDENQVSLGTCLPHRASPSPEREREPRRCLHAAHMVTPTPTCSSMQPQHWLVSCC